MTDECAARRRRPAAVAGALALAALALALAAGGLAGAPQRAGEPTDLEKVVARAVELRGVETQATEALEHVRGVPERRGNVPNRLSRVDGALRDPWATPELARELRDLLAAPATGRGPTGLGELCGGIAAWLDLEGYAAPGPAAADGALRELDELWRAVADPECEGRELLEALSAYLGRAHLALDEGLAGLEGQHWELLFERHAAFCETWYRSHFPGAQLEPAQRELLESFPSELLSAPRQDRARLLGVAAALGRLAEPAFVKTLAKRLGRTKAEATPEGFHADVRVVVGEEPGERVVLAGRRPALHDRPAALVIDLGGDDRYERAAVVDGPGMLASVVIDLKGDDRYESASRGPAYAAGGVALLVDVEGDDEYRSGRLGQAAAALGFAALLDRAGDDTYALEDYGQGHALCGVGLLYDLAGDDDYSAWAYAQGGGLGYGLSALVDGEGSDRYLADLHWPDVYGDSGPEIYHGASQGYCTGMRPGIAGGLAALLDLGEGQDRYQSGNFSQGGGYYFSFGLMFDGGGDDENLGTRYSQGFGVHQAVGVRWDAGGDDRYACRSVAHTGMAWDEGVGFLLEEGGDDTYGVGGLACGGAAQTGVAVCVDFDGKDVYRTGGQSQGGTGGSEYHKKPALGVLIDLGGDEDDYSAEGRGDELLRVDEGVGVFLDTRAKDLRAALASKLLRGE